MDTQANPGVARHWLKVIDDDVFAVSARCSGSIMVSAVPARRDPQLHGGGRRQRHAAGQPVHLPYRFHADRVDAQGRTLHRAEPEGQDRCGDVRQQRFRRRGATPSRKRSGLRRQVVDISTDPGQVDFSGPVLRARQADADAVFVYLNEEESARALRELRKQGWTKPIVGDVTLISQKVIELAGDAANGAVGHSEMTADAPVPSIRTLRAKFEKEYGFTPDHNGIKGYIGLYMLKAATEKVGKFDRVAVARTLHGMTITAKQEPGVLLDVTFDDNGDIDRESFLVEVKGGKAVVKEILPPLGKK
jgi:branched-chain amino acid transport system substrate-binding protein